ncbi:hypothetical protein [Mycoplasma sp. Mirounga ES2805-ORL]|uniref:hypothetical protein n=1 Tax=Mycoplasma sp. Mirounga ES2805-ORL TaxID=754514 RepID=UPI00197BBFAC|nr:hypothetical protein [Mycoplasma sp. Mirounga ES2805-ORL]QSF13850.1 hypothetical protein JXZ90_00925 [Mycoplasma sp. Mirounga ES2805-ORL]
MNEIEEYLNVTSATATLSDSQYNKDNWDDHLVYFGKTSWLDSGRSFFEKNFLEELESKEGLYKYLLSNWYKYMRTS